MRRVEAVATRISQWGEGPVWQEDRLYYVDIKGRAILSYHPGTGEEQIWPLDQQVGFVVPCRSNRLLYGGDQGLFFLDKETGISESIHDPEPELTANRFNDGKCSPDGRLFAGTIATDKKEGAARLYRLDPNLSCSVAYGPVTNSNGIVWTGDGTTCYYIDTPTKKVLAFRYDRKSGKLSKPRVAVDTSSVNGSPDGMAIDAEDKLWIAFCHGGCVIGYDPVTANLVERIDVPARETTACAFGGPSGEDLYITTGLPPTDPESDAGRLFVVRSMGVKGRAAHCFAHE